MFDIYDPYITFRAQGHFSDYKIDSVLSFLADEAIEFNLFQKAAQDFGKVIKIIRLHMMNCVSIG